MSYIDLVLNPIHIIVFALFLRDIHDLVDMRTLLAFVVIQAVFFFTGARSAHLH